MWVFDKEEWGAGSISRAAAAAIGRKWCGGNVGTEN